MSYSKQEKEEAVEKQFFSSNSKLNFYILYIRYFYQLFLFVLSISYSLNDIKLGRYPCVKRLNNNKYIVVDQKNIIFMDENFNKPIKEIDISNIPYQKGRSTSIAQFPSEYDNIILIINHNNFYILEQNGDNLSKKENIQFIDETYFYSLIPYNKKDNKYNFYIIYLNGKDNKVKYSKGTYDSSLNIELSSPENLSFDNIGSDFFNIDCSLMEYDNKNIISCFYGNNNNYICQSLDPENNLQIIKEKSNSFPVTLVKIRYFFKSRVLPGKQRAILCTYSKNDIFDYAWYDISINLFYNHTVTGINYSNFYAFSIYIEYFEETHEILIGKPNSQNQISTIKCSKELECTQKKEQLLPYIGELSRVNIIYSPYNNKYYTIVTDFNNPNKYIFELDLSVGLNCSCYYNYEKTSCLSNVPDGFFFNDSVAKTIEKCDIKCSKCDKESQGNNKCLSCNNKEGYYSKSDEVKDNNNYISCYKNNSIEGFYLNLTSNSFEQCFSRCKSCIEYNKCTSCNNEKEYYSLYNQIKNQHFECYHKNSIFEGLYLNITNKLFEPCQDKCKNCTEYNKCLSCNNEKGYYSLYNETNKKNYECFYKDNKLEGLYLNEKSKFFEPCFKICKSCSELGDELDNKCDDCIDGYKLYPEINKEKRNCYKICEFNYYINFSTNEYQCTEDEKCPEKYKLISKKKKCVQNCTEDNTYIYEYKNECLETYQNIEIFQESIKNILDISSNKNSTNSSKVMDNFVKQIRNGAFNDIIEYILTNEEELTIQDGEITYLLTTSNNENDNTPTKNNSVIKLGECETKLKNHYKISQNESLLIFKADIPTNGISSTVVEYEVYHPITREILNMSICQDIPIEIHLSAYINEKDIDKYDSESDYYNDICYSVSNENDSDITVDDRREEFINNNFSICEPTCKFMDYINNTQEAICECNIKKQLSMVTDILINKGQFFQDMKNIESLINLKVIKCYKLLLSKEFFLQINFGNYICLPIIFLFIIFSFIFFLKGFSSLKIQIKKIFDKIPSKDKNKQKNNNCCNNNKNNFKYQSTKKQIIKERKNNNILTQDKKNFISKKNKSKKI